MEKLKKKLKKMVSFLRNEEGFTLIELVMVMVVLAILSAVAIPKYYNMKDDAVKAKIHGLTQGLRGAQNTLYAAKLAKGENKKTDVYELVDIANATNIDLDGAVDTKPAEELQITNNKGSIDFDGQTVTWELKWPTGENFPDHPGIITENIAATPAT
ncbi:MAG: type II secretion system protein [bacterium]